MVRLATYLGRQHRERSLEPPQSFPIVSGACPRCAIKRCIPVIQVTFRVGVSPEAVAAISSICRDSYLKILSFHPPHTIVAGRVVAAVALLRSAVR